MGKDMQDEDDSEDEKDILFREEPLPFAFNTPGNWRDWMANAMWTEYSN
ncbi:hypothetical protein PF010_g25739 [Phytophthora fragariae]|uniref:Uncharacterized protein n=1 Tax=Phytophthora fragariae TaxID=53985 RepID=A0A6G0JYT8_9STRA|nr:hypothetical protein PF010_g25739 [Phytophthora fragariae]